MPRKLRDDLPGAIQHVFARGNDRRRIFRDDADRRSYLSGLGAVVARNGWMCLAYCLMDNHVHLLLETPQANLAVGMRELHGTYAQLHNRRHGRSGHLFQGRYGSVRMSSDEQLWGVTSYIAWNPVAARLVARPEQWAWNSHALVVRWRTPRWLHVERLLSHFQGLGGDPRERYIAMIAGPAQPAAAAVG